MTQKLYCYVDESGQDTEGELFIVALCGFVRSVMEGNSTMQELFTDALRTGAIVDLNRQ